VEAIHIQQQQQQQQSSSAQEPLPAAAAVDPPVDLNPYGFPGDLDQVSSIDLESFMPDDPTTIPQDAFGSLSGLPPLFNSSPDLGQQQQQQMFGTNSNVLGTSNAGAAGGGGGSVATLILAQQQQQYRQALAGNVDASVGAVYSAPAALVGGGGGGGGGSGQGFRTQQQQQQQGEVSSGVGGVGPCWSGPAAVGGAGAGGVGGVVSTASYGDLQVAGSAPAAAGGGGVGAVQSDPGPVNTQAGTAAAPASLAPPAAREAGASFDAALVDQLLADIDFEDDDFSAFLAEGVPGDGGGDGVLPSSAVNSANLDLGGLSDMLMASSEIELLQGSRFHKLCRDISFRRNDSLGLRAMSGTEQ